MPKGHYIDWDELRDGVSLWQWARDKHEGGTSWTAVGAALGIKPDTLCKAVERKAAQTEATAAVIADAQAEAMLPEPPEELPAFVGDTEPAVLVTERASAPREFTAEDEAESFQNASTSACIAARTVYESEHEAQLSPEVRAAMEDQRMAAMLSARQRESDYATAMAESTMDTCPRITLPADIAQQALVTYAWCTQKPRRLDKANDSRAAADTAQRIMDECGEAA